MMCIATQFPLVGFNLVSDASRRAQAQRRLLESGRTVITLDHEQIDNFAGNVLEFTGSNGRVLALSERAADSLHPQQRAQT